MAVYAIGDIHGFSGQLDRALRLVEADGGADAPVVFLGDYTDRGPDSRGVLDRLIEGREAGRPWRFVQGNHDRMFLNFVTTGEQHDANIESRKSWLNAALGGPATLGSYGLGGEPMFLLSANGGWETLASYEVDPDRVMSGQELIGAAAEAIPDAHIRFLSDLELWVEHDDLLFVHAGLRPGIPLEQQVEDDLIWIRQGWLDDTRDHGRLVVHGHTALEHPAHHGNRVNMDGGAGYGRPLVPAVFENGEVFTLTEQGRAPLRPETG
ncbi:serine/threonine protein phosphatase [Palleronia sediminis]|uniref:Serine/threonine protein phosphatase n=1 Tax=Palleronia sediminis TaxID=2547833 RepID=A0A4R6A6B0_9RHOB|nr:metallophosphoesterase [Palleronia sediminis]TDL78415.1 serine/threonine protein phosphatase [Palleronia sediminis]